MHLERYAQKAYEHVQVQLSTWPLNPMFLGDRGRSSDMETTKEYSYGIPQVVQVYEKVY